MDAIVPEGIRQTALGEEADLVIVARGRVRETIFISLVTAVQSISRVTVSGPQHIIASSERKLKAELPQKVKPAELRSW
jgi:hypothetical protein